MTSEANREDMDNRTNSPQGKSFSISVRVFVERPGVWQLLWMKEEFGPLFLPSAPEPAKMLLVSEAGPSAPATAPEIRGLRRVKTVSRRGLRASIRL
jgi:hypothetical protein